MKAFSATIERAQARREAQLVAFRRQHNFTNSKRMLTPSIPAPTRQEITTRLERLLDQLVARFGAKLSTPTPAAKRAGQTVALAVEPSPNPNTPPARKAIFVTTDKSLIDAGAEAAGGPIRKKWLEVAGRINGDRPVEYTWSHQGRTVVAIAFRVKPFPGSFREVRPMDRFVALEHDGAAENAAVVTSTLAELRGAIQNRDVFAADRTVRELGGEGWPTKITGV